MPATAVLAVLISGITDNTLTRPDLSPPIAAIKI